MNPVKLGQICKLHYGKGLQGYQDNEPEEAPVRVFGTNGPIGWTKTPLTEQPTIIIGRKGAYRGVHFCDRPSWTIDTAYFLTTKTNDVDLKWLYYRLLLLDINRMDTGSAIPSTKREDFYAAKVSVPSLSAQHRIASILSAYDDLIENNRRRIQLLDQAARLLYKEWFVHLRFPGHEHVKITDGIPEGWEKGCVGNLADVKSGYAFKSKDWQPEGNPVIKIKNIVGDGTINIYSCDCVSDNVAESASKFRIADGTLLIAMTGATVGKVGIMQKHSKNFFLNQRVGQFRSKHYDSIENFLFPFFQGGFAQNQVQNLAGGAAQPNISSGQIESIELLIPEKKFLDLYLDSTKDIFRQRQNLLEQNKELIQARDLLLPRLMNGEISV